MIINNIPTSTIMPLQSLQHSTAHVQKQKIKILMHFRLTVK
jgi:hypothetical protein